MTVTAGSQVFSLGMAHTREWHELVGIQKDHTVPLNQIQCPFCGIGEPLDAKSQNISAVAAVIPNGEWQHNFDVRTHESFDPQGNAFQWNDEFPTQKYGLIILRCKSCENSFFVHYLLRAPIEEKASSLKFWSRLIVPNIDFVERENARWAEEQRITKLISATEALERKVQLWQVAVCVAFIVGALLL